MKKCQSCGSELGRRDKVCPNCGAVYEEPVDTRPSLNPRPFVFACIALVLFGIGEEVIITGAYLTCVFPPVGILISLVAFAAMIVSIILAVLALRSNHINIGARKGKGFVIATKAMALVSIIGSAISIALGSIVELIIIIVFIIVVVILQEQSIDFW